MIDRETLIEVLELGEKRRAARRRFLKAAGAASIAIGGSSLLAACNDDDDDDNTPAPTPTPTPAPLADADVLNFALNLEYLEANYYIAAATGSPLNGTLRTGTGTQGDVVGGRAVTFTDPTVASYAREIAADENEHVVFLRSQLGASAVAMPQINIDGGASGAFTAAARAAGVVTATGTFDPYASDDNWLLGGMLLSDVGVTAYKGSAQLLTNATILEAAAGILATEAYHSGLIRTLLYRRGLATPSLRTNAGLISDARDSLDGPTNLDEGIVGDANTSNIVPADSNGIVFGRTAAQVLNIAYLNKAAVTSGGFFPAGTNGNIKTSGANG
ncbi:Ferritin-like domain-containing protein [Sphingomonas gellani]|uniref:Ferritin-like domain-containing protein n=1 Tax=Sphingomonas gellani TaxID=1166340 RepID=A0A1H8B8X2_9SPHN|nr:ferritin-like domain-containing protein [Sphingomonas gellani]SEM79146.1 Ferritin-like domain-containing protein [Sphingomonas gellani]